MSVRVTDHAIRRYNERVTARHKHRSDIRKIVEEWCEKALSHSKYLGVQSKGQLMYGYSNWNLILTHDKEAVITITQRQDFYETVSESVEKDIKESLDKTIRRMVKPLIQRRHELVIEIHSEELKRMKVHHPDTKKIIGERIENLNRELDSLILEISAHSSLAYKYGLDTEDIA